MGTTVDQNNPQGATILNSGNVGYYPPPQNPPPYPGHPPPVMHQPGMYQQGHTVVQATVVPALVVRSGMGSSPTQTRCRSCNIDIVTRVEYKPSMRTHLMAAILCLVGCWPCVCVPYCIETCNNIDHYCPNCGAYVGSYLN